MKRKTAKKVINLTAALLMLSAGICIGKCLPDRSAIPAIGYEDVRVCSGDKLWTICADYCPEDMDIREYICKVQALNCIGADIYPGQVIKVIRYE